MSNGEKTCGATKCDIAYNQHTYIKTHDIRHCVALNIKYTVFISTCKQLKTFMMCAQ